MTFSDETERREKKTTGTANSLSISPITKRGAGNT